MEGVIVWNVGVVCEMIDLYIPTHGFIFSSVTDSCYFCIFIPSVFFLDIIDWGVKLVWSCCTTAHSRNICPQFNITNSFDPSLQLAVWQIWDSESEIWPIHCANVWSMPGCWCLTRPISIQQWQLQCWWLHSWQLGQNWTTMLPMCRVLSSMSSCDVSFPIFLIAD